VTDCWAGYRGLIVDLETYSMTNNVFCLPPRLRQEIISHARSGKPQEICGIVRGRGQCAFEVVPGRNVAPNPINDYTIDNGTLLLQFEFEEDGDEMVAIYHSHPVSPAYPSASDAWNAHYPDCVYLICSLQEDEVPVLRGFRMMLHELLSTVDGEEGGEAGDTDVIDSLIADLDLYETRPGLFAHYQPAGTPVPTPLRQATPELAPPFYVVFEETSKKLPPRIVSIVEYEIQLTDCK
jgi:proteasome lid subunit RPN8/RPN11